MNSESVDLIATDPPFNKGRDFHATPDSLASGASFQDRWSWEKDVHDEWVDQITDDFPKVMNVINGSRNSYGDDMGAFLCFMAVRLLEMKRVLKGSGSIYLHCDPTASHYLKELMDAIFNKRNFRNSITWQKNDNRAKGSQHAPKKWGTQTDTLLFYTKSDKTRVLPYRELTPEEMLAEFPNIDSEGNRYKTGIPLWCQPSMGDRPNLCYTWRGFTNPHPSGWRLSKERMEEEYQKGNILILDDKRLERRLYLDDYPGKPVGDLWTDISPAKGNERTGYPTQKPLKLYERIIKASSNPDDVVLDPFCGCATTPVAAEHLGRQWVGIDIWDKAHETVIDRLKLEGLTGPSGDRRDWLFSVGDVYYESEPPKRTDDGLNAVPFLKTKLKVDEPKGPRMSRAEMVKYLLEQQGWKCQGCDREFDDPRYLELDHNTPRSDGGLNHISNRILLCGPCNKLKSNTYTLSGLRRQNKKLGYMVGQ